MMRRVLIACCTGLVICLLGITAVQSQSSNVAPSASSGTASQRGSAIFRRSCSVCHGIHQGETKVGPSLYGELRQGSGHTEQQVGQVIVDGKGNMPSFKEKLDSEQMKDLIAYLKTL
jgi:mono/diheme cytochrome c family protein